MEDSFKGARKNLNVISILLLILWYTDIDVDKISILGLSSAVEDVSKVYIIIWALLAFYLFRYMQMLSFQLNSIICKEFCQLYGPIPPEGKRYDAFKKHVTNVNKCPKPIFEKHQNTESIVHISWLTNSYYVRITEARCIYVGFPLWKDPKFAKNVLNFMLIKPHFLNYFLPIIVLIFVAIIAIDRCWEGSLWSLFGEWNSNR